ncbi:MAG: Copper binding protein plastocyanin/azurin family [Actinomycetota bacterium]
MRRMVSMATSYPAARWNTLVRGCAVVSAIVEIARGLVVLDRESIAIGVLLLLFTAATFTRRPALGWIGVAALFVNQAFWMMTATVNLAHAAPSLLGAAIPSVLSIASTLGLVASVARSRGASQDNAPLVAWIAGGALVVLLIAVPVAGRNAVVAHPGDLRISARNVKFSTTRLTAHAGDIGVVFTNKDLFWHTFTIGNFDVNLRVATSGRGRVVLKDVPAGTYSYVCAIPGHESAGMKGELVVR